VNIYTKTTLFCVTLLCSCNDEQQPTEKGKIGRFTSEEITPRDLNIKKETFFANPSIEQVAIFRTKIIDAINPERSDVYDQISWRSSGRCCNC